MKKVLSSVLSTLILGAMSLPALAIDPGAVCDPAFGCAVPEPESIALVVVGLIAAVAAKRFGKRK